MIILSLQLYKFQTCLKSSLFLLQIDLHEGNIPLQFVLIAPNWQMNTFINDLKRKLKTGSVEVMIYCDQFEFCKISLKE